MAVLKVEKGRAAQKKINHTRIYFSIVKYGKVIPLCNATIV